MTSTDLAERIDVGWRDDVIPTLTRFITGPDEFLHLPTARRVTECIARLLGAHAASPAP